jgi:hypothetical protein
LRAGDLGLAHSVIGEFTRDQLQGKSVVIMPGMSSYDSLMISKPLLSAFVHAGGYLWVNLAGTSCAPDAVPGGAGFVRYDCGSTYHNSETIAQPNHPYFTGAFTPAAHALTAADFANWDATDGGHISGAPSNATALLTNTKGSPLMEYSYGSGWIVVSTMTYGWGVEGAKTAALDNMLLYAASQVRGSDAASVPTEGVPEPSTLVMLASGSLLVVFAKIARRR